MGGSEARLGKGGVRLAGTVGCVFGSTFAIDGRDLVVRRPEEMTVDATGDHVDDNRELRAGRENQALDDKAILELKAQGTSGMVCGVARRRGLWWRAQQADERPPPQDIISKLVESSATFEKKTECARVGVVGGCRLPGTMGLTRRPASWLLSMPA